MIPTNPCTQDHPNWAFRACLYARLLRFRLSATNGTEHLEIVSRACRLKPGIRWPEERTHCARCCRRDYAEQIAEFEVALHTKCVEASSRAQTTCPPLTWQCVDFKNRIITISKSGGYSLRSDELADDTNCCHSEEQQRWVRTSICLLSPRAWF